MDTTQFEDYLKRSIKTTALSSQTYELQALLNEVSMEATRCLGGTVILKLHAVRRGNSPKRFFLISPGYGSIKEAQSLADTSELNDSGEVDKPERPYKEIRAYILGLKAALSLRTKFNKQPANF